MSMGDKTTIAMESQTAPERIPFWVARLYIRFDFDYSGTKRRRWDVILWGLVWHGMGAQDAKSAFDSVKF